MKKSRLPELYKDFRDFIQLCNSYDVRYLVIGGYAVSIHGYPRGTDDLDIIVEGTEENAEKIVAMLKDFGMGSLGLKKEDFLIPGFFTQLGYPPARIDIMNEMDSVPFAEAWLNKKTLSYQGQEMHFIGYNELLKMKAAASRSKDLVDIEMLRKRNKKK